MLDISDDDPETAMLCGGTLVASKYVISATHCFFFLNSATLEFRKKENIRIWLGDHNIKQSGETLLEEKKIRVANLHHHPNFGPFDITVVELAESVDLNVYTPACLARTIDTNKFLGKYVTVAGWGFLGKKFPDVPHEVQVPVTKCEQYELPEIPPVILCAQESGKAACQVRRASK